MQDKRDDYKRASVQDYLSPNLSNSKHIISFLHLLLTQDKKHQEVFHKVPIIGFQRAKILEDILQKNEGFCEAFVRFKSTTTQRTYFIRFKSFF